MSTKKSKTIRLDDPSKRGRRDLTIREQAQEIMAGATFKKYCARFSIRTPQQLRDQVIWQAIREIRRRMARNNDERLTLEVQDLIFELAQDQQCGNQD